jgi:hypothetical protein
MDRPTARFCIPDDDPIENGLETARELFSDDDNLLSDDSFMEELTSATVQEARPVSVKSPV